METDDTAGTRDWFDPSTYPGVPPDGPVLVWNGDVHDLDPRDLSAPTAAGAPVLDDPERRWVLTYGSNADRDRLADKGLDERGCLLLPARVAGWVPAWEARRSTSTGAVPLTLVERRGALLDCWVLGVHSGALDRLDRGEFRGRNYRLGAVGEVAVAARWRLSDALAFGPGPDTHVLAPGGDVLTHPGTGQQAARAALEDARADGVEAATTPAPQLPGAGPEAAAGGWPRTDLGDLDLFVYGTLQPGDVRWKAIAEFVEVVGPAATTGSLTATPRDWPAARFDPDGPALHGTLLRPHSRDAAETLYRITDEIEGVARPGAATAGGAAGRFRRVAVPLSGDAAPQWAAAYEWGDDTTPPPGEVIADGRWRGARGADASAGSERPHDGRGDA